jgi:DNA-binding transcriptional ArsR family regulator
MRVMSEIDAVMEIDDIGVLEILNNSTRLKILSNLEEPSSVKSVANAMSVPATRLYYHINLLEGAGLIRVVETRKVGAMIERLYQAVADTFRPGQALFEDTGDLERLAKVASDIVLDGARLDAETGLLRHFEAMAEGKKRSELHPGTVSRSVRAVSRSTAEEFLKRLEDLVGEWSKTEKGGEDAEEFSLSIVFFPLVSPTQGAQQ